jgi:hypothetical protein
MGKIIILPIIAAFIAIVAFAPQDAHAATSYTAISSTSWNIPGTWLGGVVPTVLGPGDTVTIPLGLTVTNHLTITNNGGTINIQGTVVNMGAINNKLGGIINIIGGTLINIGNINNLGIINNNGGTIKNIANINNGGTINNNGGTITNLGHLSNQYNSNTNGIIHNNSGGTINNPGSIYNPGTIINLNECAFISGNTPLVNPITFATCHPSIPDFPFSYSLVIIFGAVAAVYMGIRQKMIPNFKSF